MFNAACSKLNSSFSYTIFFVSPKLFNGLPRRLKTACRFGSRLFVIEPLAESPSVMKMQLSSRLSPFVSFRWIRQSRSFLLCRLAFFARSRASLVTPAIALRSFSDSWILRSRASDVSAFLCR